MHPWLTMNGQDPLPSTEENCIAVEVTDEDVANATRDFSSFPLLVTMKIPSSVLLLLRADCVQVLIKTMGKRKSLKNPFLAVGTGDVKGRSVRYTGYILAHRQTDL